MRIARLLLLVLTVTAALRADDVDALMQQARAAEDKFDAKTALALYLKADAARPNDPVILQKIARQYSDLTFDLTDQADQRRICAQALSFAKRAYALAPKQPENALSVAICYAKIGFYADTRTKIETSRLVKEYAEQALALAPN